MSTHQQLEAAIAKNGPLTVAEYMAICLYDPQHGYYTTRDPLGAEGDFITVPEMTQMFGELLGLWVCDCWVRMDRPKPFNLIEIGPGRGTLMSDMLRAIDQVMPELAAHLTPHLVEVSPHLIEKQKQALAGYPSTQWTDDIKTIDLATPAVVIANELLDALPIRQFALRNGQYYERLITTDCGGFAFTLAEEPTDIGIDGLAEGAPAVVEQTQAADALLTHIAATLNGYALFIDYGGNGYADTLQAQKNHKMVDPLAHPGTSDLTTHVNFKHVRAILGTGASSAVDISPFLLSLGLASRAQQLMEQAKSDEDRTYIGNTVKKLVDPNEMGRHFKALAYRRKDLAIPAGFND